MIAARGPRESQKERGDMSSSTLIASIITGTGTFLTFALEVAFLIVILTSVRPKRPDAAMPLLAAAGIGLFVTIVGSLVHSFVTPAIVRSGSHESIATIYAVIGFIFTLFRLVALAALLFGIVKLANPPRPNDPTRYG